MTKQLRQTILPTHVLGAAGTAESDALGYFSLVAGGGITLTPASGSLSIAATGSGTVTSVGLSLPNVFTVSGSPVTGSGTLTATLATQSANQVFVGPSTGANAAPTFRALLLDDIPALSTDKLTSGTLPSARGGTGQSTYTDGQLLIGRTSDNGLAKATLTAGTGISITNGSGAITIAATNSGTVTSVTGTAPVASSGGATPAISLASGYGDTQNPYASKTAAHVLAAPSSAAGVPTFRSLVAGDLPSHSTDLLTSGTLPVARGGTGITSLGTGIATFLGTPSSANLAAAVTDETGTGALVFAASPSLTGTVNAENLTLSGNLTVNGTTAIRTDLPISNTATGGGTYTLQLSDIDRVILANTISISIPTDATLDFPIGTKIWIYNNGTAAVLGTVNIVAASPGTTTVTGGDSGGLPGQGLALLYKVAANTWCRLFFVSGAILAGSGTITTLQGTSASFQRYAVSSVTTISGTSHTLVSTNNGAVLRFTASSAVTITIPTGLSSSFSCSIIQEGTGQITITPDAGVTRNAFGGATKTAGRYAVATLIATASNTFILGGQVVV
jgi:hypothetical protein